MAEFRKNRPQILDDLHGRPWVSAGQISPLRGRKKALPGGNAIEFYDLAVSR